MRGGVVRSREEGKEEKKERAITVREGGWRSGGRGGRVEKDGE